MFTAPDSQGTTGERSHNQINQDPFNTEFTKTLTKSSPRFGALSHHSFFSRHNPHPHRVTHIQGLNGRPICMVRDDWCVTSSLFPHPLLKGHVLRKSPGPAFTFPLTQNLHAVSGNNNKSALFSEAWRDELKELVAKVNLSFRAQLGKNEDQPEDEFVHQKTQYSADTGRIIPPSSKSYLHRSHSQHLKYPQPFQDQELTVLELLCQILQTDSLSTVQQWLLLAGQREKDLVMGMLRRALDGVDLSGRRNQRTFQQLQAFHPGASPPAYSPSFDQPWRKPWRTSSYKANPISGDDKPERIGDAEVLEIHAGPQDHPQDPALQST
ncbi:protein TBATA-like isoform X1 [Amphiprion ocellaris]|nr:protein TBATA-like isoform X1 [Amphiprion ocellaris]XP_054864784.1 protein TBATA-like isoform X1 [Amphiprion ocellaris]XP_054875049.1 protein TBATA-like isoform X1 [Amphiprion ocellaris]XP_054875050.1 protein TBATA-like isoform X1 [Amphiprion ocellaris]